MLLHHCTALFTVERFSTLLFVVLYLLLSSCPFEFSLIIVTLFRFIQFKLGNQAALFWIFHCISLNLLNLYNGFCEEIYGTIVILGRSLEKHCFKILSKLLSHCLRNNSIHVEITLVAHNDQGEGRVALKINQLLVDNLNHLKTLLVVN